MEIIEIEKQILKFWRESHAFKRSVDKRSKNRSFVFFEGPPTANGRPGFHHVEARSFKDVICRYKTMKGFCVERRGGWDTHGLPVELEVERELGINNKKQIEEYVRQWVLKELIENYGYPKVWLGERIIVEETVQMATMEKQADISIKNERHKTFLYIETTTAETILSPNLGNVILYS